MVQYPNQPPPGEIIPNIQMDRVSGRRFVDAPAHYGTLGSLAEKFGRDMAAHRHDQCFQIHFIESGTLTLALDSVPHQSSGPVLFFTPPAVPHAFVTNDDAHGHVLTIDRSLAWQCIDSDASLSRRDLERPHYLALSGAEGRHDARQLIRLFRMMRAETQTAAAGGSAAVQALTSLILVAVLRLVAGETQEAAPRRHEQSLYRRFNDLVEHRFPEHWPISRYATHLAITEVRLTNICRRVGDKTPKQIAIERLFLESRRLLAFSSLSVGDIASVLGYDDSSYFARLFHKREGMSPSQYRARIKDLGNTAA